MSRKSIGYTLLIVSAVAASVFASPIPVLKGPFAASLVVMAFSLWLVRSKTNNGQTPKAGSGQLQGKRFDHLACLESVAASVEKLARSGNPDCESIHRGLDPLIEGPLFDFARNREALLESLGYSPYAQVMSAFTQAERILSRAWSAAVDSYPAEAAECVNLASELFTELVCQLKHSLEDKAI
ncbi:MAG: hypothetical protein U9P14_02620 [Gemmatimonadota bacterium]|nr:hypothetical protein [Gemmatimonadota bacterium]